MIRFVAALLMMTTGLFPVFGAGENNFFTSAASGKHVAAGQSRRHEDRATSERPDTRESRRERAHYPFFHFDSKLGNIAVEPVVGKVNGAQLYVSF